MTKIDIYSGFLGAGKTTLIKKMIQEAYQGEKLVLIENEFGEIGIDGGFLQEAGIQITEMNSGCICCSLVGDFSKALRQVIAQYAPDRILIEPSGVGKLSDVIGAIRKVTSESVVLGSFVTVADATKCKMYMKNFGEFYNNQIETAPTILLSRTASIPEEKLNQAIALIREHNHEATIVTTPWEQLNGKQILDAMEQKATLANELAGMAEAAHQEQDDDDSCCHDHEHHHDHEKHEHHHDDAHECCCHDHEHHHDHEEHEHHHDDADECCCHDHEHHHHHADEVFTSWGMETPKKYTKTEISAILSALEDEKKYGLILRAKGFVPSPDGTWVHFDYVPGEPDIRTGPASVTGRLCVIGSGIQEAAIAALFGA